MGFRLPVDRSFVLPGRGTIVTGTAATGRVAIGDSLCVHPGGRSYRVRGLQRHGEVADSFAAPGRIALDLAAASTEDVPVGSVLATEGALLETVRVDAWLRALPHLIRPLKARQRVTVHIGTTHVEAAVTQLSGEPLPPGEAGFVQLHLDRSLAIAGGEGFIVRSSAADPRFGQTIAGGHVLHPAPARHKLADPAVADALGQLLDGEDDARVAAMVALARGRGVNEAELAQHLDLPADAISRSLKSGLSRGRIRRFGRPPRYLAPAAVDELEARALAAVDAAHARAPERAGVDDAELGRQIGAWMDTEMIGAIVAALVRRAALVRVAGVIAQPGFSPTLVSARPEVHAALHAELAEGGLALPTGNALVSAVAERCAAGPAEIELACREAVAAGLLVQLRAGYVMPTDRAHAAIRSIFEAFAAQDTFTTGELKQVLGLTRKHLIPFAEFLDAKRLTVRAPNGDRRFRGAALQRFHEGDEPWR